ncbi:MAG TPA: dTDP-4-dehydrorhamnose reductase, partial [Pirellulales bacterium]
EHTLRLDATDPQAVEATFRTLRPDVVVNAAAFTDVDGAESDPQGAHRGNVEIPKNLAGAAARYDAGLIHFSTDYVFDGRGSRPYREDDPTGPLSVYGQTKLAGEQAILDSSAASIVLRCSWVYGLNGAGFVKAILEQAANRDELEVVDDQIGAPTSAAFLARTAAGMVERLGPVREGRWRRFGGLFHLAGRGEVSRCGWAEEILAAGCRAGLLRGTRVAPIPSSRRPTPARRPLNSRLDVSKFTAVWGVSPPFWDADLRAQLPQILAAVADGSSVVGAK